ncbi:MAG: beta-galactosidase trimerization domain-containing protein [Promethearchaeota archaeon]
MVVELTEDGFFIDREFFFPIGVNYWPRDAAFHFWKEYDRVAVEGELKFMRALGINTIRVFITWADISSARGTLNRGFFSCFEHFHVTATRYGIKLIPTLFACHVAGRHVIPGWFNLTGIDASKNIPHQEILHPPARRERGLVRDIYLDDDVYREAFLQLEALLTGYKDSTTVISWDISNENQQVMRPANPGHGFSYMKRMRDRMKELDPNHPVTLGMGRLTERSGFHSFGAMGVNHHVDYVAVHSRPSRDSAFNFKKAGFYTSYGVAFDVRFARMTGKPVQLQEFGLHGSFSPRAWRVGRNNRLGGRYSALLYGSLVNGARCGVLARSFTDFAGGLKNRQGLNGRGGREFYSGIVDRNYEPKASGEQLQEFATFMRRVDFQDFKEIPSGVAIMLPENYNDYVDLATKIRELKRHGAVKHLKSVRRAPDCTLNRNRSLFNSFVFCKMAGVTPDFATFEHDLSKYRLLLLPNLRSLTHESFEKLDAFTRGGGYVYISSNDFIPKELTGGVRLKPRARRIGKRSLMFNRDLGIAKLLQPVFNSLFELETYKEFQHVTGVKLTDALYFDKNCGETLVTFKQSRRGKIGGFILFLTSPEINHARSMHDYKRETMHLFYRALFELARLPNRVKCLNHLVEIGEFKNDDTGEELIFIINHEMGEHNILLEFQYPINQINEVNGKPFSVHGNATHFSMEDYSTRVFRVERGDGEIESIK